MYKQKYKLVVNQYGFLIANANSKYNFTQQSLKNIY